VNLYAEHLTKELGKKFRNSGSTEAGIEVIYNFLDSAGVSTGGMFIEDGSGLSPVNAINSAGMVTLLRFMKYRGKYFSDYFNSLPVAGKEGTLRNYFLDDLFSSSLRAKSGSMTRVRSYAGYFTTKSGRDMVFSMIVNDFSGPSRDIVTRFEALLKDIILNK
jgi:D-alanyl-D-alanine carboxypeptidase/D-alanyl-D-alanine-endopeptidase (penicillin-binding protein 4)